MACTLPPSHTSASHHHLKNNYGGSCGGGLVPFCFFLLALLSSISFAHRLVLLLLVVVCGLVYIYGRAVNMEQFIAQASTEERASFLELIEEMQMKDVRNKYNGLTERCFDKCIHSFKTNTIEKDEDVCVSSCSDKFMKHEARVQQRFAEENYNQNMKAQGK